jgi:hypothetical protein
VIRRGQTFVNKESRDVPSHLWVVVSDPVQDPEQVVIVNITTLEGKRDPDRTCVVMKGEHNFISRPSYVLYAEARIASVNSLGELLRTKMLSPSTDASEEFLRKVIAGFGSSKLAPNKCKAILRPQGGIA